MKGYKKFMLKRMAVFTMVCTGLSQVSLGSDQQQNNAVSDTSVHQQVAMAHEHRASQGISKNDLIQDAQNNVKKAQENTDGQIDRVACTYKVSDNDVLTEKTVKVYYRDYRKAPDYSSESFTTSTSPTKVIEVTYNTLNKHQLSLVHRENNKKVKETVALAQAIID